MNSILRTLLDRVEQGEGADYDLNLELACLWGPFIRKSYEQDGKRHLAFYRRDEPLKGQWSFACGEDRPDSRWHFLSTPSYVSSLDDSRALVQAAIPGTLIASGSMEDGPFCSMVVPREDGTYIGGGMQAFATSEPRAVLACLLRAKIAQEGEQ